MAIYKQLYQRHVFIRKGKNKYGNLLGKHVV